MTALDNVVLAAGYQQHVFVRFARCPQSTGAARWSGRADILARVGLAGAERKLAGALPLGQLKRLEVARALALDPKIILLDEPLAGLNHAEASKQIDDDPRGPRERRDDRPWSSTISKKSCGSAEGWSCSTTARIIADGRPDEVMADPIVREAYIGAGASRHAAA